MGKWTDKLYITHGEWKSGEFQGGLSKAKKQEQEGARDFKRLPFDHCALSLQPFVVPVMSPDGVVFDFDEIDRFMELNADEDGTCKCPITGKNFKFIDLLPLKFHKNAADEYCCPVTGRVFADSSKIMANVKTGQVYSAEAVDQMCESGIDFVSNEVCRRSDYLAIVDPGSVRNCAPRLLALTESSNTPISETSETKYDPTSVSSGKLAASLTSTAVAPVFKQEIKSTEAASSVPKPLRNAKVVLSTTHGDLEATLFAPMMPVTVYNFLVRAVRGDYCQTSLFFVNTIALQTATNIESDLPCKIKERPHKALSHSAAGMIGMCSDTDGRTPQFYVTLQPASSLDGTNRLFGKLELTNPSTKQSFEKMVACGRDAEGRPLEYMAIIDIVVMYDPFTKEEAEKMKKSTSASKIPLTTNKSTTIGKYLKL